MNIEILLNNISGLVWGPITLLFLLGVGVYLMFGLKGFPLLNLNLGIKYLFKKSDSKDTGDISSFESLMTALSATVGTGNIAGVATAIFIGGPGAIFWMWITALFGMATKYSEAVLAVTYREKDKNFLFLKLSISDSSTFLLIYPKSFLLPYPNFKIVRNK